MKVKDATNWWLLVWNKPTMRPLTVQHFFPTKGKSACGKVGHPRTQPNAFWIQHKICKACLKVWKKLKKENKDLQEPE